MFRRSKKLAFRQDHAEFMADVAIELDEGLKLHRRALERLDAHGRIDDDLLEPARRAAMVGRASLRFFEAIRDEVPEVLWPFRGLRALASVEFGLIALAQDPPDREAALTREELDALVDEDLADWMRFCLESADRTGYR